MSDRPEIKITVSLTDHGEDAMFLRSVRCEGEAPDGERIEVAVNEMGFGIIVTLGRRSFVLNEVRLAEAVDAARAALAEIEKGGLDG